MKKILLIFFLLIISSFAFADIISPEPISLISGSILVIAGLNFIWNYLIAWITAKATKRKDIFSINTSKVFACIGVITIAGLVIDIIALILAQMVNGQLASYSSTTFPIAYFLFAGIILLIINFLIIKVMTHNSNKESLIDALALAIFANPGILVFLGSLILLLLLPALVIGFVFMYLAQREAKNQTPEEQKKSRRDIKIVTGLIALGFVLLIVSMIFTGGHGGRAYGVPAAKDAISNSLSSVKGGGTITSQSFTLSKEDILTSKMFTDKGFDEHSIVFDVDKSITTNFIVNTANSFSSIKYTGATKISLVARIICEINGTNLNETLTQAEIETTINPTTLCGPTTGSEEYQPCCLVILKRA